MKNIDIAINSMKTASILNEPLFCANEITPIIGNNKLKVNNQNQNYSGRHNLNSVWPFTSILRAVCSIHTCFTFIIQHLMLFIQKNYKRKFTPLSFQSR